MIFKQLIKTTEIAPIGLLPDLRKNHAFCFIKVIMREFFGLKPLGVLCQKKRMYGESGRRGILHVGGQNGEEIKKMPNKNGQKYSIYSATLFSLL